ncbi:MAG: addiction module toxin RelE, partial [Gammaproteobacteria bacterium]
GQGSPGPWEQVTGQIFLGDDEFVRDARRQARGRNLKEIPRRQRFAGRPALKALFAGETKLTKVQRNALIQRAHREHGYTLVAIANTLGLHYTTVSKVIKDGLIN